jgi:outer membrane protein assembly factor BamB
MQEAPVEKLETVHPTEGSPAASTPATDGEKVYSYFGSGGVFAYTVDGKKVWEHRLPTAEHVGDFGTGTSPIVHDGIVLVNRDMLSGSHLLALRATDGSLAWRAERPRFISSYTTPVIWEADGAKQVVLAGSQRMKAYDLKSGEEKWQYLGLPNASCPTPVVADGLLIFAGWSPTAQDMQFGRFGAMLEKYDKDSDKIISRDEATSGALRFLFRMIDTNGDSQLNREEWESNEQLREEAVNQAFAIRPGKGELTDTNVAWKYTRGLPYVPSGLFYRDKFYMARDGGMVTCLDAKTGKPHYEQERLGPGGSYYPSPVAADGRIYLCSNDGKITVIAAGDKPEVLSRAELGERCFTTPAIAHNRLFIRSAKHLWCFGE